LSQEQWIQFEQGLLDSSSDLKILFLVKLALATVGRRVITLKALSL
jgi:hypothetical protein